MSPVVHPKTAMREAVFLFSSMEKQQCAIFLSIEQEAIHTNNDIGRRHILFDIRKSKIDSNV